MKTQTKFKEAYKPKQRVQISFGKHSMTKQSHAKEADINYIVKKYHKTGILEHWRKNEPEYGFANSETFHESMNIITKAQNMFDELPSNAREYFNHSPANFLDFVNDPETNISKMRELGLAEPAYEFFETQAQSADSDSTPLDSTVGSDTITTNNKEQTN